jgi:SPOR domain
MADDHRLDSYRSNDPQRRAAEPSRSAEPPRASDPLAELARLIGQRDPFAEFGRSNSRQTARQAQAAPAAPAPQWQPQEQEFTADQGRGHEAYGSHPGYAQPAYGAHEQESDRRVYDEVPLAADHQGQQQAQYAEQHGQYGDEDRLHESQQYAEDAQSGDDAEQQYYQDDVPFEPHEDELYDDPPPARRRSTLVTALALVGCALLGTVGAYAYRSFSSGPSSTEPPPVITADNSTPTKIVPTTAGDAQSGKADTDRVANADKEQLVSKQEEPVALKEPAPAAAPRIVPPPPSAVPAQGGSAAQSPSNGAGLPSTEPKKIRTVTIRPDGSDVSGKPVGMPAPTAPQGSPAAAPSASQRPAPTPTPPAPAASGRTQTAAAPATDSTSPGFVVQLSSQKSESEAMSSFRSLQAKFPNELGGRQPIIRRADLGSKGVFYRTLVGPFGSAHEASQFCASYRAAGGQCVVPNN